MFPHFGHSDDEINVLYVKSRNALNCHKCADDITCISPTLKLRRVCCWSGCICATLIVALPDTSDR